MSLIDVGKKIVGLGAPLLGMALFGPGGEAFGSMIANELGASSTKPEDILAKLSDDPATREKLIELQNKHQEFLLNNSLQIYQAEEADRASAREREADIAKATGHEDYTTKILAYVITVGFLVCIAAFLVRANALPPDVKEILLLLMGVMGGAFTTVVGYYFGSSMGSKQKTDIMNQQVLST